MSFLAPLFALGFLAVAAPVVFHLIRRRPQGEVPFSSLMFLTPTPPRLTSRSRLDHILLLILRATALGLIGLAFMRPFLRVEAAIDPADARQRRIAVLIDTSASLRRGDLWQRARAEADAAVAACRPTDLVGVFAFDAAPRTVLGFKESSELEPSQRLVVARERVTQLAPTWGGTELGAALADTLAALTDAAGAGKESAGKIVLVSDLQQGSRLAGLAESEWPSDVELELRTVTDGGGNAGLERLADSTAEEPKAGDPSRLRVRVVNDAGSGQEQFRLAWVNPNGSADGAPIEVYVPPGESRVVRVPWPADAAPRQALRLTGDTHPFDNTVYIPTQRREEWTVLFVGPDAADDPSGLCYFLDRTWADTPERTVRVLGRQPNETLSWDEVHSLPLAVVAGETAPANAAVLRRYVQEGGTLLYVLAGPGKADTLAALADAPSLNAEEAKIDRYAMLRDVAFDHPLFAPLAGPQYGDFTKIHFWKHRRIDADGLGGRVIARFDDGDPAVVEKPVGTGRLVAFAAGWHPADGQLARSSKFVPVMTALLEQRTGRRFGAANYRVGDPVPVPADETPNGVTVRLPNGSAATVPPGVAAFAGTDVPGAYAIEAAGGLRPFAVNLDPAESLTSPLPVETLEQMGCRLADRTPDAPDAQTQRQMRDIELESSQSIWRWLVLAAVAVLFAETLLAGRLSRSRPDAPEAVTP